MQLRVDHRQVRAPRSALALLATIVHGADVEKDIAIAPQAAGLKAIAEGFAYLYGARDHEKVAAEAPGYDALYEWCRRQTGASAR